MEPFEIINIITKYYLGLDFYSGLSKITTGVENEKLRYNLKKFEIEYFENCSFLLNKEELEFITNNPVLVNEPIFFDSREGAIDTMNVLFMNWFSKKVIPIFQAFALSHHKSTDEIFYNIGMELIRKHDGYRQQIIFRRKYNDPTDQSIDPAIRKKVELDLSLFPNDNLFLDDMELRAIKLKVFIGRLSNFSSRLSEQITYTEDEKKIFNDLNNDLESKVLIYNGSFLNQRQESFFEYLITNYVKGENTMTKFSWVFRYMNSEPLKPNILLSQVEYIKFIKSRFDFTFSKIQPINNIYNDIEVKKLSRHLKEFEQNSLSE